MKNLKLTIFDLMVGLALGFLVTACSGSQVSQSTSSPSPADLTKTPDATPTEKSVLPSSSEIDFSTNVKNVTLKGFSYEESWGRWTDSSIASIKFDRDLPNSFHVILKGRAFGPNVNQDITLAIGAQQKKFRLEAEDKEVKVNFKGVPANERTITFTIPQPTRPKQLGQKDERKLGVGLKTLTIEQVEDTSKN